MPSQFQPTPIAAALLLAFALPASVSAQTPTDDSKKASQKVTEKQMPEVSVSGQKSADDYNAPVSTIGGKTPTPVRDIPQSVTVINKVVMDQQAAYSLPSVLRNVPGITLGAAEGGTIGNNINLRGFSARTDVYLDGARDRGQYYRGHDRRGDAEHGDGGSGRHRDTHRTSGRKVAPPGRSTR